MVRKKYDVAAQGYKTATETAADQETCLAYVGLASAYTEAGKILTIPSRRWIRFGHTPDLNPVVKQVAQGEKARAEKGKAAKK